MCSSDLLQPFWIACALSTIVYGYASTKLRSIRSPLFCGFVIYTAGTVGLATIQPSDSTRAIIFSGLSGLGFGAPLILIVAGVQLSTPHHLIATATAATTSARAVAATVFTAIYSATLNTQLQKRTAPYISKAALEAGLPADSVKAFVQALTSHDSSGLEEIPGISASIINAGTQALKQSFADSVRIVFIIAVPFGVVGCLICLTLGNLKKTMNYRVDAPVEKLSAKTREGEAVANAPESKV